MRVVLMASGDFAVPTLRSLKDHGHQVACVITQPDKGSGRGRRTTPTPVKAMALELGHEVICTNNINDPDIVKRLRQSEADIGIAIAFGQKVGAEVRGLFRHQCINLHASLLPKYRGAAPFQWTVINGEEEAGVTVFRLVDKMDAGPVYLTRRTLLKPEERACELHDRLACIGVDAVNATLELLTNEPDYEPSPQDGALATKAPKLSKADGFIRFDTQTQELANRICGLWSWPGAVCEYISASSNEPERITLALARIGDSGKPADAPGTLDYRLYAATADGYLEILEVKPASGRLMAFRDFVNGRHVKAGDKFVPVT